MGRQVLGETIRRQEGKYITCQQEEVIKGEYGARLAGNWTGRWDDAGMGKQVYGEKIRRQRERYT